MNLESITINEVDVLQRNMEVLASQIDKEIVIYDDNQGKYFSLNKIGSTIWGLLEKPQCVASLLEHLQSRFKVNSAQCESDVLPFLRLLIDKKLIVKV